MINDKRPAAILLAAAKLQDGDSSVAETISAFYLYNAHFVN